MWWTPLSGLAGPVAFRLEKRQVAPEVYNEDQRLEAVTALAADVLGPC